MFGGGFEILILILLEDGFDEDGFDEDGFDEDGFDEGLCISLSHAIVPSAGIITSELALSAKIWVFEPHFLQNLVSTSTSFWQLGQRGI